MRTLLDTSVLIAAHDSNHVHHERSFELFAQATVTDACCAAHTLAEFYSVITRVPVRPAVSPAQAMLFLNGIRERLTIVTLNETDYIETLETASSRGLPGGQIYDALLARCAIKVDAQTLYTWNVRHFERVAPELSGKVRTP